MPYEQGISRSFSDPLDCLLFVEGLLIVEKVEGDWNFCCVTTAGVDRVSACVQRLAGGAWVATAMVVNLQAQETERVNKTRHVITPLRRLFVPEIRLPGIKQLFGW